MALATAFQSGLLAGKYFHQLRKIADDVGLRHKELLAAGAIDNAETQIAALKHVIADTNGYAGDVETYDDIQNADLTRVMERRKGMPITLALIYIHAARAQGWDISGLDFPGHFLCRLEKDGKRLIFDVFERCKIMEAPDLRKILKKIKGPNAELSADYFLPAGNRSILMRLENNIKYRQIEMEDYEGALRTVETMRFIDAQEYRLLLDTGVLCARTNRVKDGIEALENYIKLAPNDRNRHEAAMLLQELKSGL